MSSQDANKPAANQPAANQPAANQPAANQTAGEKEDEKATEERQKNVGFLYHIFDWLFWILCWLNLIEWAKLIVGDILRPAGYDVRGVKSVVIDLYQVAKWAIVLSLFLTCTYTPLAHGVVVYLICSNVYSYFYHHTWKIGRRRRNEDEEKQLTPEEEKEAAARELVRQKRRYLTLLMSVAFFIVAYAYLYLCVYNEDITWPKNAGGQSRVNALYLSVANTFTMSYEGFSATTQRVRLVLASQVVNTFIFLTIILSVSIPQAAKAGEK